MVGEGLIEQEQGAQGFLELENSVLAFVNTCRDLSALFEEAVMSSVQFLNSLLFQADAT